MVKRIKKPSVPPDTRRDWLRRNEEFGETPPMIAKADRWDVRTVRTHIELASRERDQKQARVSFVKDNMEKHHQDMCNQANNLLSIVTAERVIDLNFSENLYLNAMQQHLSRSPLWNKIKEWNNVLATIEDMKENVKDKLEKSIRRTNLKNIESDEAEGVVNAAIAVLAHQFEQWTRGNQGLDIKRDWIIEGRKDGKISVCYGFSHFGWIEESDLDTIKKVIGRYETRMKRWSEYQDMEKQVMKLRELSKYITTERKGIIIRRVLPGSCTYCPI